MKIYNIIISSIIVLVPQLASAGQKCDDLYEKISKNKTKYEDIINNTSGIDDWGKVKIKLVREDLAKKIQTNVKSDMLCERIGKDIDLDVKSLCSYLSEINENKTPKECEFNE